MRRGHRVVAIIPALNEARSLPAVLERIPTWFDAVVVADNASTDRTAEVARAYGALVVRETQRGYGAACQAGVQAARGLVSGQDLAVFFDGDGSDDPREAAVLVGPILDGEADLVTGRRLGRGRMLLHQRLGTEFVAGLLRVGFGVGVRDLGPFRAIRLGTLERLGMTDRGFGWTAEMQARAYRFGLRAREVPVSWRRGHGPSKVSGTLGGTLRAGRDLTRHVLVQLLARQVDRVRQRQGLRAERWPRGQRPIAQRDPGPAQPS